MYQFPHGLEELEGIANRTDFDLGSHTKNQRSKYKCKSYGKREFQHSFGCSKRE